MGEALGPEGTEYDLSICRHDDLPNERARARAAAVPNLFMIVASLRDVSGKGRAQVLRPIFLPRFPNLTAAVAKMCPPGHSVVSLLSLIWGLRPHLEFQAKYLPSQPQLLIRAGYISPSTHENA